MQASAARLIREIATSLTFAYRPVELNLLAIAREPFGLRGSHPLILSINALSDSPARSLSALSGLAAALAAVQPRSLASF